MKLLPDTQLLLQAANSPTGPGAPEAVRLMGDPDNEIYFSAASIWEVAIKFSLHRPDFDVEPLTLRRALLDNAYLEVPVTSAHAAAVAGLPAIHKDPFDRVLVAQAAAEGLLLITTDAMIGRYPGPIRLV